MSEKVYEVDAKNIVAIKRNKNVGRWSVELFDGYVLMCDFLAVDGESMFVDGQGLVVVKDRKAVDPSAFPWLRLVPKPDSDTKKKKVLHE